MRHDPASGRSRLQVGGQRSVEAVHASELPFHSAVGRDSNLVSHDVTQLKAVVDARAFKGPE